MDKYYSNDCKKHNYGLFDIFSKPFGYVYYCIYCRHSKMTKEKRGE